MLRTCLTIAEILNMSMVLDIINGLMFSKKKIFLEFLVQWLMILRYWVGDPAESGTVWWQQVIFREMAANSSRISVGKCEQSWVVWISVLRIEGGFSWLTFLTHIASLVLTVLNIGCTFFEIFFIIWLALLSWRACGEWYCLLILR